MNTLVRDALFWASARAPSAVATSADKGSERGAAATPADDPSAGAAAAGTPAAAPSTSEPWGELPSEWFRDYFELLWRFVARLGVPADSVDDVVQEAFIAASQRRADILHGCEKRFLIGAAVRLSSNYRRRASVRHELRHGELVDQAVSPLPDAEQLLAVKRARIELEAALSALSSAHRDVFVLYELEGFSVPEISELLEVPIGTVASRLGRARAHFCAVVTRMERVSIEKGGPR